MNQIKLQNKIKVTCFNYLQIQLIRPPPVHYGMALRAQVSDPSRHAPGPGVRSAQWSVRRGPAAALLSEPVLHSLANIAYMAHIHGTRVHCVCCQCAHYCHIPSTLALMCVDPSLAGYNNNM